MTTDIYWRLGMSGDFSSLRHHRSDRGDFDPGGPDSITPGLRQGLDDGYRYVDHAAEVVRAAELSGFCGGLLPSFPFTEDPWVLSAALARASKTFRFMIAFQPGFLHPVQAARMSATLQRATGGRVVYNVITGGGGPAQLWWGDRVAHDDRYARTSEFLDVLKGVWNGGGSFDFDGRFYQVKGAGLPGPLSAQPFPEIYFSGSSAAAIDAAGRHSDYYLSWLEPFESLQEKFDGVRAHCDRIGRTPRFALRIDIMARKTEEAAWEEIRRGWEEVDPVAFTPHAIGDSVGADRSRSLRPDATRDFRDLEVSPNVWSGFAHLRDGPAWGLVGSYEQVAERLDQLMDLGTDAFILASNPHLEEAYRVGEEVLPLLRGRTTAPAPAGAPRQPAVV